MRRLCLIAILGAAVVHASGRDYLRRRDLASVPVPTTTPTLTALPSATPTSLPTMIPTTPAPSAAPTISVHPTFSALPTQAPTSSPADSPTVHAPSAAPTVRPTPLPTTSTPSVVPTASLNLTTGTLSAPPTLSAHLTPIPSSSPTTTSPTTAPTSAPTATPTTPAPSVTPTASPQPTLSFRPTATPTTDPSSAPTVLGAPTSAPPSSAPTAANVAATATPTLHPTVTPTQQPTATPTRQPTAAPTTNVTVTPTSQPTVTPLPTPTPLPTEYWFNVSNSTNTTLPPTPTPDEQAWWATVPWAFLSICITVSWGMYHVRSLYEFETELLLNWLDSKLVTGIMISLVVCDIGYTLLVLFESALLTADLRTTWFHVFSIVTSNIYLAELVLKMGCFNRVRNLTVFFEDRLSQIDFLVVSLDVLLIFADMILENGALASTLGMDGLKDFFLFQNAGLLRALKLARMLRLMRVVRASLKAMHIDLLEACQTGNTAMLRAALRANHSLGQTTFFQENGLHLAAAGGHLGCVKIILPKNSRWSSSRRRLQAEELCRQKDKYGRTPLFQAVYFRRVQVVEYLLMYVDDLDYALNQACSSGAQEGVTVRKLIAKRNFEALLEKCHLERTKELRAEEERRRLAAIEEARLEAERMANRARVLRKLGIRIGGIFAQEARVAQKAWRSWLLFVDSLKYGKFSELESMVLTDLTKMELKKHLEVRRVPCKGRLSQPVLVAMLQQSITEERAQINRRKIREAKEARKASLAAVHAESEAPSPKSPKSFKFGTLGSFASNAGSIATGGAMIQLPSSVCSDNSSELSLEDSLPPESRRPRPRMTDEMRAAAARHRAHNLKRNLVKVKSRQLKAERRGLLQLRSGLSSARVAPAGDDNMPDEIATAAATPAEAAPNDCQADNQSKDPDPPTTHPTDEAAPPRPLAATNVPTEPATAADTEVPVHFEQRRADLRPGPATDADSPIAITELE